MKWLRLPQVEDGVAGYEAIRSLYSRRIFPTVDGVRNTVRILSRIDPKFSKLKAEDLVDERGVRKLEKEGLFKQQFATIAQWGFQKYLDDVRGRCVRAPSAPPAPLFERFRL